MWARFFKFISTNSLIAGSIAAFVGTVAGTWFVAWRAPDVGSIFSVLGRWLRAPAGSTRIDEITLALVAILFGFISCAAIFLREAQKQKRLEAARGEAPAFDPAATTRSTTASKSLVNTDDPYESVDRYYETKHALEGRFAELETHERKAVGRKVCWYGFVRSVSSVGEDRVIVLLGRGVDDHRGDLVTVRFPAAGFRERLFALRVGDQIRIAGEIRDTSLNPTVEADSLDVIVRNDG